MAVRAYFSGVESKQHFQQCVSAKVGSVLMSYWQFYQGNLGVVAQRKKQYPEIDFMIDSGAHSFQADWTKWSTWSAQDFDTYVEGYVEWLRRNRDYVQCGVELDIDYTLNMVLGGSETATIGDNIVRRWQDKLFRPLQEIGIPIIYVWHKNRGMDGWVEMCQRFDYVGLPGEYSSAPDFNRFMTVARRYGAKVHGFAASLSSSSRCHILRKKQIGVLSMQEIFDKEGVTWDEQVLSSGRESAVEVSRKLPRDFSVWTLDDDLQRQFKRATHIIRHESRKRVFKIVLRGGKEVEGTEDHSFFKLNHSGKLIEVSPLDLKIGDYMVSSLGMPEPLVYETTTVEDAEFYGVWFGDGFVRLRSATGTPSGICVSKQHQSEIRQICEATSRRWGAYWSVNGIDGNMSGVLMQAHALHLIENFGRVGKDKYIGPAVLNMTPEARAAFLCGYFSTDGSCGGDNRNITLVCYRKEHLQTVQLLLEYWDIRSSLGRFTSKEGRRIGNGKPLKRGVYYRLSISDQVSRALFEEHIGFLQKGHQQVLACKNKTVPIAGIHRGLPVELLRESGRLYRTKDGQLKSRPVYAKDRRTAEIPQNFGARLLGRQCEYLQIQSIEAVEGTEHVYDLCVPGPERFFANGILAHNTKQLDFRDAPWYTVDSITWKTGEMYGLLIDWDARAQHLTMVDDKTKRRNYQDKFIANGFDADAIINDTNYKEVTRYSLWSMRQMELFYARRYAHRRYYYELRLPHPRVLLKANEAKLRALWDQFRPQDTFPKHQGVLSSKQVKAVLVGIASAQSGDYRLLQRGAPLDFLQTYFPKLTDPLPSDPSILQQEMASFIAPSNPPPKQRVAMEHIEPVLRIRRRPAGAQWSQKVEDTELPHPFTL